MAKPLIEIETDRMTPEQLKELLIEHQQVLNYLAVHKLNKQMQKILKSEIKYIKTKLI